MTASTDDNRTSSRPSRSLIGTTISDRYRIDRLIGEGGMGAVYEAQHTLMRKRMAIKVLHPEMTRMSEVVERFSREAQAAAHIESPHVVNATDFGKLEDGSFFLALEYIDGKSLRDLIAQGRVELGRALHIARQIALALLRAHSLKIVHRDLKPENVMLTERDGDPDFVKVLDFGIAKVPIGGITAGDVSQAAPGAPVLTQAGMVYGTPEYMAPEQALGQNVDASADLYALGVIIYEMLAGVRPFEAESKVALLGMHVTAPIPPFSQKAPEANIPAEVEAVLHRLMAKESSQRLGDARELVSLLSSLLEQLGALGLVDPKYAPSPSSGLASSPAILSGISPPVILDDSKAPEPLLAGRAWLVAAGGGLLGLVILAATIIYILASRDPKRAIASGADAGAATTTVTGKSDPTDPPLEAKVKEAIAMIDDGNYASGIKTLEDLGDEVKGREDVHRALFKGYSQTDRTKEALREVAKLLKIAPLMDIGKETKIRVEVRDTALKEGMKDKERAAVDAAFELLTGPMGRVGWDDLYDMGYGTSGQNYPKAAQRAKTELAKGKKDTMSPALAVTVDLHRESDRTNCAGLKNLLDEAVASGDIRTLAILKQLQPPRLVGHYRPKDTLGCIHGDKSLDKAVADLSARLGKK